jgi:TusA-related sulfurtransferase
MTQDGAMQQINLAGIAYPICLLELKRSMGKLNRGEKIRVTVDEADLIRSIQRLCRHSPDRVIEVHEDEAGYSVVILKG